MIIGALSTILTMVSGTLTIHNGITPHTYTETFTGSYPTTVLNASNPNFYTLVSTRTTVDINDDDHYYDIYFNDGTTTFKFYTLEINPGTNKVYVDLTGLTWSYFDEWNVEPSIQISFYTQYNEFVNALITKPYSNMVDYHNENGKYYYYMYQYQDTSFSTPISSRQSGQWWSVGGSWKRMSIAITWSYKPVFNDSNGSYTDGYNTGYNTGYSNGYGVGYDEGETNGINQGYADGQQYGYTNGYNDGINTAHTYTFGNLFKSIVDTPIWFLQSLFGFSLFGEGETLIGIITSLITVLIVIALIKKVF